MEPAYGCNLRLVDDERDYEPVIRAACGILFDQTEHGCAVLNCEGHVLAFNAAFSAISSVHGERLLEASLDESIVLDEGPDIGRLRALARREGPQKIERHLGSGSGTWKPVSLELRAFGESGEYALLVLKDLSEGRRRQRLIASQSVLLDIQQRLRLALESTGPGTWDYNLVNQDVLWSDRAKEILGFSVQSEPTFSNFLEALLPDDRPLVLESLQRALDPGSPSIDIEYRIFDQSRGARWIRACGRVFFEWREGRNCPVRMIGTVVDVTDRKRAQEEREAILLRESRARAEAEDANRIKDRFLATVSHELRTPINAISGWTQLLSKGLSESADFNAGLEAIARNTRVLARLINDMLDMSAISTGKLRIEKQRIGLSDLLGGVLRTHAPQAAEKRVEFISEPEKWPEVELEGDPSRLEQALSNVLGNAIKFTGSGKSVRLSLQRRGQLAEVMVQDEGEGIDAEFLPNLFEPFAQQSSSNRKTGFGLGLAIAKHLIEAHGGSISASSEGPGKGATFLVLLPSLPQSRLSAPNPSP